jgi:hypothetical protein
VLGVPRDLKDLVFVASEGMRLLVEVSQVPHRDCSVRGAGDEAVLVGGVELDTVDLFIYVNKGRKEQKRAR